MIGRRDFVLSALAVVAGSATACASSRRSGRDARGTLGDIEARVGGRLGVAVLDVATGDSLTHRESERFPMCSTFKWLLAAQVLARVDAGAEKLDRRVSYGAADLLEYAPIARRHLADGAMSVGALCAAIIQYSDNTAANLLLATVGGPSGHTRFLRSIGDEVTRLDRIEPDLNSAIAGDPRDTTTPAAMLADLRRVLLGTILSSKSREQLTEWLVGNTTGGAKLRAGLPKDWRVGDKTGMGENGATNDVAIAWPDDGGPLLVSAYLTETSAPVGARNAALADVARTVVEWRAG